MTKEEIGLVLKELRTSCGMTQKEVAEKIGRTQQIVGHWETGYAQPDANTLFTLCNIYGVTVDDAFGFQRKNNISKEDYERIRKYKFISTHSPNGANVVDSILDREYGIATQLKEQAEYIKKLETSTIGNNESSIDMRLINYYYRVASAGTGQIIFDMPPTKRIEIPNTPEYRKVDYAIGVNGNSMEPTFHDGDMLLVEMTEDIEIGDIGIFRVDNESYVKKLGKTELISINPATRNIPLNETAKCMGKVIDKMPTN